MAGRRQQERSTAPYGGADREDVPTPKEVPERAESSACAASTAAAEGGPVVASSIDIRIAPR